MIYFRIISATKVVDFSFSDGNHLTKLLVSGVFSFSFSNW